MNDAYKMLFEKCCYYLDQAHSLYVEEIKQVKDQKFTDEQRGRVLSLQYMIASLLDCIHAMYPSCYDLYPERTKNLDAINKLFKLYQQNNLLLPCLCDACKTTSVEPKQEQNIQ